MFEVITDLKEITGPIHQVLKPQGFKRLSPRKWYRITQEIGQVFWLDRFRFEPKNRLHLYGIIYRLDADPKPTYGHFSLQASIDEFSPAGEAFMHALDQEYVFDPPERRAEIIRATLQTRFARLLAGMDTEAHAVRLFKEIGGCERGFNISGPIREQLQGWFDPLPEGAPQA